MAEKKKPKAKKGAWLTTKMPQSAGKQLLSLRLDSDVIAAFRKTGQGYQSLMNDVLRTYAEHHLMK